MADINFNFKIPHSKDECIPRIIASWFYGVALTDQQEVMLTVEQLKMIMVQVHDEGRTRQLEYTSGKALPPLK